jgi:hypothetical protein
VTDSASRAAGRSGEPGLGELVGGGLVLVPPGALEVDAELAERVAQEHLLDGDAGEPERAGGLEVDPVESGGEVVRQVAVHEVAERFRPCHRELARLPEVADGGAQFLDLGQPDARPADLDHERPHPVVGGRTPQAGEHVLEPGPAYGEQGGKRVSRLAFGDPVGQVKFEYEWPSPALPHAGDLPGKLRLCHADSLRG